MQPRPEPKSMARALRAALLQRQVTISHATALEIVAAQHGAADWNTLAATFGGQPAAGGVRFGPTCPIMRIYDEAAARDFYVRFLGF
jgi:hypothetical protein